MSDFDEEAERERLREQYERDREEREATERMSELLLQGATMTSAHCSECGDPIFRYDGQEFCATCERPVDREEDAGGDEDGNGDEGIEVTTPSDESRVVFGGDNQDSMGEAPADERQRGATDGRRRNPDERRADAGQDASEPAAGDVGTDRNPRNRRAGRSTGESAGDVSGGRGAGGAGGDIEAARDSLGRTLAAFSRRAEETDDPKRAREHLQAAREAAEALAALRR